MNDVKVAINYAGVGELLKSREVEDFLKTEAESRARSLGPGYATDTYRAGSRVIASIYTDTADAARENMKNNTLLKAVST